MTVEVVTPPRKFRAFCRCTAELEYTGADVIYHPNGMRRWGKATIRGVKCPVCGEVVKHHQGPPPAPLPPQRNS